jgi:tetratricopeptide (TPR) repeat protein
MIILFRKSDYFLSAMLNSSLRSIAIAVLFFWVLMGLSLSAKAQPLIFPDSMANTLSLLTTALATGDTRTNSENQQHSNLLFFLQPFQNATKAPEPAEWHYLSYCYLGFLESKKGNDLDALHYYEKGRKFLAASKPFNKYLGHFYLLSAKALLQIGDNSRALQSLKDAEEVFVQLKDTDFLQEVYHLQSDFYLRQKQEDQALAPLDKSIKQYKKNLPLQISSLIKRANLYSEARQFDAADKDFAEAELLLEKSVSDAAAALYSARGLHLLRQNKPEEAMTFYDEALEQVCPGIREKKSAAFPNCLHPKVFLNTLQLRGNIIQLAFDKAPSTNIAKKKYNNYITGLRYLQYLTDAHPDVLYAESKDHYLDDFLEESMHACWLLDSLEIDTMVYFQQALQLASQGREESKIVSLKDAQNLVAIENTSLLFFFCGTRNYYALLIDKQGKQFKKIARTPLFEEELQLLLALHHVPFQSIQAISDFKTVSHRLYEQLFKGLAIRTNKLIVLPDGLLSYLPFESFVVSSQPGADYPIDFLLFHKQIQYAASFTQLKKDLSTSPLNTRKVITFAPKDFKRHGLIPLKGIPGHMRFLEIKFQCEKWINGEATIPSFTSAAQQGEYNMVVFNTHAEAGEKPWICFFDEKMPLTDLPKVGMRANIAILSSCNTPVGNTRSHTVLTIANTFSESGIHTAVIPLWSVSQQMNIKVAELFYLNVASGMNKDEALTKAKIKYLKSCGNNAIAASPHFWAANILTGNTQPIYKKSYLLPGIILLLLVLLIVVWRKVNQS